MNKEILNLVLSGMVYDLSVPYTSTKNIIDFMKKQDYDYINYDLSEDIGGEHNIAFVKNGDVCRMIILISNWYEGKQILKLNK